MNFQEANDTIKDLNLDEESSLTYKAGIIFFIGFDYGWDLNKLSKETGYSEKDISTIIGNWEENKILVGGKICGDFGNEETNWMEFILICMCVVQGIFVECRL